MLVAFDRDEAGDSAATKLADQDTSPGLQPFGFKRALSDPVAEGAGLVWMGVRAYVPSLGRFATPDPAGVAAGPDRSGGDGYGGPDMAMIEIWDRGVHLSDLLAAIPAKDDLKWSVMEFGGPQETTK